MDEQSGQEQTPSPSSQDDKGAEYVSEDYALDSISEGVPAAGGGRVKHGDHSEGLQDYMEDYMSVRSSGRSARTTRFTTEILDGATWECVATSQANRGSKSEEFIEERIIGLS